MATFQEQATGLLASARGHKRAVARHRRGAKRDMMALADLQKLAAANGIRIIINHNNGEGEITHGQAKTS